MIHANFGQEPLEAEPSFRRAPAASLVFIDHLNLPGRPAEFLSTPGQAVLQSRRLAML
jgi:hypothetical protein